MPLLMCIYNSNCIIIISKLATTPSILLLYHSSHLTHPLIIQQQHPPYRPHHAIMINPFTTNHDSQFLFRKNYLGLHKSTQTSASPQHSNNLHIQTLQRRNPFTSNSPIIPTRTNIFNSPERPLSAAKNYNSLSQSRFTSTKGGILEEADGWRRELERKQREKMQIYGAQGLRYNAYVGSPRQRIENSDYYQLASKKQQDKYALPNLKSSQHYRSSNNATDYYLSPSQRQKFKNVAKQRKEQFQDQFYEQSPNFNIQDPRRSQKNPLTESSRHSKVKDMFESQFEDRFKQSMNYNSFYGGIAEQTQFRNRMLYNSSKIGDSKVFRRQNSVESEIGRLDVIAPDSINVGGRIYYKVSL